MICFFYDDGDEDDGDNNIISNVYDNTDDNGVIDL